MAINKIAVEYTWEIQALYIPREGWEIVCTEPSAKDAREQKRCYQENEPGVQFRIVKRNVPVKVATARGVSHD